MRRPLLIVILFGLTTAPIAEAGKPGVNKKTVLRAGIIGLDTSHVIAFTKVLNDKNAKGPLAHVRVVAGYPGGSKDIPSSANRVDRFTKQLKDMGIQIVDSIPELLKRVDVVLLESVDGRPHLKQVIPVFKSGKPVFIDKPLAGSLADAIAIQRLAKKYKAKWFTSSSLRFSPGILAYRKKHPKLGKITGASAWSPCPIEKTHPDLFWYGVHGVETLYTIMGKGCISVTRINQPGVDLVVGTWSDGRIGTFRGIRSGKAGYGAMVFGQKGFERSGGYGGYKPLVTEIAKFFLTGNSPVDNDESIELFAFMEAADESKRRGGVPVKIADVLKKAQKAASARIRKLDSPAN